MKNFRDTTVVIVAGGRGVRLGSLTDDVPKPMIRVVGRPVLEHILQMFYFYGFRKFVFSVCYKKEAIIDYFGDGKKFGVEINYVYEDESKPLGNAGGIGLARDYIDNTFVVTFGDVLRCVDIKKVFEFHEKKKGMATVHVFKKAVKQASSMVLFDDDNRVLRFVERPDVSKIKRDFVWQSSSFFIMDPDSIDFFENGRFQDFGCDIFPKMIKDKKKIFACLVDDYHIDVGTPELLAQAEKDIVSGKLCVY